MNHYNITSTSSINREQLIQMLNKDLASQYRAIIAFIVYSQVLKRASHTDIAWELELHAAEDFQHAKEIARQIDHLGGIPCVRLNPAKAPNGPVAMLLSSIVRNLEHEIDLASLLGIGVAHTDCLAPDHSSRPRQTRVKPMSPIAALPGQRSLGRNAAKQCARNRNAWTMSQPA